MMTTYHPGDLVRIADDAPLYASRTGEIVTDHRRGGHDGYWLTLNGTGEMVWIPAAALTLVKAGEQ